jgi:hypothetical protein
MKLITILSCFVLTTSCFEIYPDCKKENIEEVIKKNLENVKLITEEEILSIQVYVDDIEVDTLYLIENIKNIKFKKALEQINAYGYELHKNIDGKIQSKIYLNPSLSCLKCSILYSDFILAINEINNTSVIHKEKIYNKIFFLCTNE